MTVLNVTFGTRAGRSGRQSAVPVFQPSGPSEDVPIGAQSTKSAISSGSPMDQGLVRVVAAVDCYIEIGEDPTAVKGTSMRMSAGQTDHFPCRPGAVVAVIEA